MPDQMWIKATLKTKGFKLKDMAETLGITAPRVTDILRGTREVQADELDLLAGMLGLNLKSLLASLESGSPRQVADLDSRLPVAGRLMGNGTVKPLLAGTDPTHVALPPDAAVSDGLYCYVMGDNSMGQEIKTGDIIIAADPRIHFYPMVPGALLLVRCGEGKMALRQFVKSTASDASGETTEIANNPVAGNNRGENWLVPLPIQPNPKLASWRFNMLPPSLTDTDIAPESAENSATSNETLAIKGTGKEIPAGETVHTSHIAAAVLWVHRRYTPQGGATTAH